MIKNYHDVGKLSNKIDHDSGNISDRYSDGSDDISYSMKLEEEQCTV